VKCDTFNTENYKGISYLDVTTVYASDNKTVYINVVNRHKDKAITTDLFSSSGKFEGKAEATVINVSSLTDPFTYARRDDYQPQKKEIKTAKDVLTFSFPAHSFTQIEVAIKH